MKRPAFFLLALLSAMLAGGSLRPARAAVYNLHLVTDNGPDYTDIESFVRSVTERWAASGSGLVLGCTRVRTAVWKSISRGGSGKVLRSSSNPGGSVLPPL